MYWVLKWKDVAIKNPSRQQINNIHIKNKVCTCQEIDWKINSFNLEEKYLNCVNDINRVFVVPSNKIKMTPQFLSTKKIISKAKLRGKTPNNWQTKKAFQGKLSSENEKKAKFINRMMIKYNFGRKKSIINLYSWDLEIGFQGSGFHVWDYNIDCEFCICDPKGLICVIVRMDFLSSLGFYNLSNRGFVLRKV